MAVKPLIGFGIGIIGAGFFWKFYDDVITDFFGSYIIDLSNEFYGLSDLVWNALPLLVIFLGIACLIFGSMSRGADVGGEY